MGICPGARACEAANAAADLDRCLQQRVAAAKPGVWDLSSLGARLSSHPTLDATLQMQVQAAG